MLTVENPHNEIREPHFIALEYVVAAFFVLEVVANCFAYSASRSLRSWSSMLDVLVAANCGMLLMWVPLGLPGLLVVRVFAALRVFRVVSRSSFMLAVVKCAPTPSPAPELSPETLS